LDYHPGMENETGHHSLSERAARSVRVALPIMAGYVVIGIPCGILSTSSGLSPAMVFLLSSTFYSGAGQFMLANLLAAGMSPASIILSIVAVSSRQMLYSACFAPFLESSNRLSSFLFAATVTDESFGVNLDRFESQASSVTESDDKPKPESNAKVEVEGFESGSQPSTWDSTDALLVNLFCLASWAFANLIGALLGSVLSIPIAISSFAMTSIFIYMLAVLPASKQNVIVACISALAVIVCKLVGLTGPAIVVGALLGIVAGTLVDRVA
jgi:predicted branched-subunit amino acid permease